MNPSFTISQLQQNQYVFRNLLDQCSSDVYLWRPSPDHWCLLEIICHLYDEEREDFRTRVRSVLEDPTQALPPIDPVGWVKDRNYLQQDYQRKT